MRNSSRALLLAAVLAMGLSTTAMAGYQLIQMHESVEDYFAGGTRVTDIFHGGGFSVGDTSGPRLWEVTEKGWWMVDPQGVLPTLTQISYTVFNDTYTDAITSFHVPKNLPTFDHSAPIGWDFFETGGSVSWSTLTGGIPGQESLDTMRVFYLGQKGITFAPGVAIDFAGNWVSNDNWVVSTVIPAPAAVLLGAAGVALVGWMKRRVS